MTVQGQLGIPGTGYYSADIYQNVDKIAPAGGCAMQSALPDYSNSKPAPSVRSYRISMRIHYRARGGHIIVATQSGTAQLTPWQAYARYWLTGGYVFYAYCADEFNLTTFSGTHAAKPWLMDNEIAMDPESAAMKHITYLRLDYTCRRAPTNTGSTE